MAERAKGKGSAGKKRGAKKAPAPARSKRANSSDKSIRARAAAKKAAPKKTAPKKQTIQQAAASLGAALTSPTVPLPPPPPRRGRPKDSPDVWTPEHITAVADDFWNYVLDTACPSLPDFCFTRGIRRQRLYEFPELAEVKDMLYAKRAAYLDQAGLSLTRDDGPRGAYIIRAQANVGEHSMTEKTENTERVTSVNVYLPDNGRGDGPKAEAAGA